MSEVCAEGERRADEIVVDREVGRKAEARRTEWVEGVVCQGLWVYVEEDFVV